MTISGNADGAVPFYSARGTVGCKKTGTVRIKLTHFYNFSIV
jgi:hypothetical protein